MMYSQFDEEQHILRAFGYESRDASGNPLPLDVNGFKGRFLDIGAWNAKDKSNTRALYELGWHGILIEPSPGPLMGIVKEYGNDERVQVIAAAVGLERGLLPMRITHDGVSTTSDAVYQQWKGSGAYYGSMLVPHIVLADISNQFGGFDFINLDAEGTSADLFLQAIEQGWEPKCWCVEHDGRLVEILGSANGRGYHAVYTNGTNVVLVK